MKKLLFMFMFFSLCMPNIVRGYETSATSAILMDIDSGKIFYRWLSALSNYLLMEGKSGNEPY